MQARREANVTPRCDAIYGSLDFAWQIMISSCLRICQSCQVCPSGGEQQVLLDATGRAKRSKGGAHEGLGLAEVTQAPTGALSLLEGVGD